MKKQSEAEWLAALLDRMAGKEVSLKEDKRARPSYWNGDRWGSHSGFAEAHEWVISQLANWILAALKRRGWTPPKPKKKGRGK